jgi:hypothetical protein
LKKVSISDLIECWLRNTQNRWTIKKRVIWTINNLTLVIFLIIILIA